MEIDELVIVELELKYCERCGALWLRRCGNDVVYCAACVPKMLDSPWIRTPRGARQLGISRDLRGIAQSDRALLALEGGHA